MWKLHRRFMSGYLSRIVGSLARLIDLQSSLVALREVYRISLSPRSPPTVSRLALPAIGPILVYVQTIPSLRPAHYSSPIQ